MDRTITLNCCGGKKCPNVTLHDDGSVTLSDRVDDTHLDLIQLTPEQADQLETVLRDRTK